MQSTTFAGGARPSAPRSSLAAHVAVERAPVPHQDLPANDRRDAARRFLAQGGRWDCYRWQVYGLSSTLGWSTEQLFAQLQQTAAIFTMATRFPTPNLPLPSASRAEMLGWLAALSAGP